ncbi:hypothetical protein CEXT_363211 [Caerostris extrusa]|uniref:Secreted protein n=1 Tax=Caerostris extrusa TaxID=172846 RepID=A0AAV4PJ39_CAEEX|nr:hypothetical protein CEXT_363211 [Caerostris extrusa]
MFRTVAIFNLLILLNPLKSFPGLSLTVTIGVSWVGLNGNAELVDAGVFLTGADGVDGNSLTGFFFDWCEYLVFYSEGHLHN